LNKDIEGFEPEVVKLFMEYSWPGNLREFRNVIRRAALLNSGKLISAKTLPWEITNSVTYAPANETHNSNQSSGTPNLNKESDLRNAASLAEYETIMNVLKQVNFNKTKAAEILKIDRKTLYNKLKGHEL
jgi:two-component system response regulator HydG